MASSQDTQVDLIINDVASETVLQNMQTNNQIEANQLYMTPDEEDATEMPVGNMYWKYDATNKVLKAIFK